MELEGVVKASVVFKKIPYATRLMAFLRSKFFLQAIVKFSLAR